MYMSEESPKLPVQTLQDIVLACRPLLPEGYRLVLFGSWAKGTAVERSDIDVAIHGPAALPREHFSKVLEALEKIQTLRKIDCVDVNMVGDRLREEILQTGKRIL